MSANNKSPHILNTSANMLGLCLIVLTSLKISDYREKSIIDEMTGIASLLLMFSSLFSFLSLRAKKIILSAKYENAADYIFLTALLSLFIVIVLITFNFL
jgi:hypothetical protein